MTASSSDHPITFEPSSQRVRVLFGGAVVADTRRALVLREASYPPVFYIPREDADMARFERSDRHTHCPYKGEASYFTIAADGARAENAVWSYEDPLPAVGAIKDHLAFYPDRVERIEVSD